MSAQHNLDLNEYSLDELLGLFDLNYDMDYNDLKECKKKVLFMHPDKSNKPPEYFLFYKKAFEMIVQYYEEKYKQTKQVPTTKIVYEPHKPTQNEEQIQKNISAMKPKEFNKTFNSLFEKNMAIKPDETKNEWFKNENPVYEVKTKATKDNLGRVMDDIKSKQNALARYKGVENMYSTSGTGTSFLYDDMENSDTYVSCDLFSKLKFEDLRKVHKDESIFSVKESDFSNVKTYQSIEQLSSARSAQDIAPFEKMASENMIKKQQEEYAKEILKKQHQAKLRDMEYEKKNKDVEAFFLRIT